MANTFISVHIPSKQVEKSEFRACARGVGWGGGGATAAASLSVRAKRAAAVGLDMMRPIYRLRPCFM